MVKFLLYIIITLLLLYSDILCQKGSITGKVSDESGIPLIGANVLVEGKLLGTSTNSKGDFNIANLNPGQYKLIITMVGYEKYVSDIINVKNSKINLNISLKKAVLQYDQIVVTASKHEQEISNLPISAAVINSEMISRKNFMELDDALRYAPGVQVTLDQVSIRGSSGYSRGAGTRVLVAVDGIPLYTGDSGEIVWEIVPTTEIDRVEIIKGSASALYGSTALGGVINVITKNITSQPLTYIKAYVGAYDKPAFYEWNWADEYRIYNSISVSHSNKIGNWGYSFSISRFEDMGYRQNDWQKKYSGYFKTNTG